MSLWGHHGQRLGKIRIAVEKVSGIVMRGPVRVIERPNNRMESLFLKGLSDRLLQI
jgi:hypothetical protein